MKKTAPHNPDCPKQVNAFIEPEMIKKQLTELESYDIDFLIAKHLGKLVVIQDWNGIFCKTVYERVDHTSEDENQIKWVMGASLDEGSIYRPSREINVSLLEKYMTAFVKNENGDIEITVSEGENVAKHVGKDMASTFSMALINLFYDGEVEVMKPIRSHYFNSNLNIPGRKPIGVTENEFYS